MREVAARNGFGITFRCSHPASGGINAMSNDGVTLLECVDAPGSSACRTPDRVGNIGTFAGRCPRDNLWRRNRGRQLDASALFGQRRVGAHT